MKSSIIDSQVAEKQCNIIADSFLPIIKKLPGLILEENVYVSAIHVLFYSL